MLFKDYKFMKNYTLEMLGWDKCRNKFLIENEYEIVVPLLLHQNFSRKIKFPKTFQDSHLYSSTFQACTNPGGRGGGGGVGGGGGGGLG